MKAKWILCAIGCAAGGVAVGLFAGRLDEPIGVVLFTFGVLLMVSSVIALSKK